MDVAASLTCSCRENRSIVSGRRLPDKNPTDQPVGKGPEGEWVLVDKPTDLIIQRGCCEIMLFDPWEFQDLKRKVLYHILGHFCGESSLT